MRIIQKCKRDRSKDWFHQRWWAKQFFIIGQDEQFVFTAEVTNQNQADVYRGLGYVRKTD